MVPLVMETGTSLSSCTGPLEAAGTPPAPWYGTPLAPPEAAAATMSALTIRPPGPLPATRAGSTPFSAASLRARGETLTRPAAARAGGTAGAFETAVGAGEEGASGEGTSGARAASGADAGRSGERRVGEEGERRGA